MIPTSDPYTFIEETRRGYTRYCQFDGDGNVTRRWEVYGTCDRRGDCLIGTVIEGWGMIQSHTDINRAKQALGKDRIDSLLDVPVTPEFDTCCGADRFTYTELPLE